MEDEVYWQGDVLKVDGEYYILLQVDSNCFTLFKEESSNRWGETIKKKPRTSLSRSDVIKMLSIHPKAPPWNGVIERVRGGVIRIDIGEKEDNV